MTGRGLRGRRQARAILFIAFGLDLILVFVFVSAPDFMGPMFASPPRFAWLIPAVGIALNLAELGWMIRIYRTTVDPESHPSNWRSLRT
jgi:hypothetical protein